MPPDSTPDAATLDEIRRFEAQYARSPESLVFARLADAYRKAGMLERALEVIEAGLVRHQGYLSAHIVRGRTLRELGRPDAATAAFHRVLDVDPQNLVALRALGEMARKGGRPEEARKWYERLSEVDPLDEQVRSTLESLEAQAEAKEAPAEATGWEPPAGPKGWEPPAARSEPTAADFHEASESTEGAPEPAQNALPERVDPAGSPLQEVFEPPEHGLHEEKEPPQHGPPAATEPPEEAERLDLATLTMAELYMRQGLYEEAERVYRQLLRYRPDDSELREKLESVAVRVRGGDEQRARDVTTSQAVAAPGAVTIRRHLHALLVGNASEPEETPRPSAFDAWLEREARG